jgi:hypothetical protein
MIQINCNFLTMDQILGMRSNMIGYIKGINKLSTGTTGKKGSTVSRRPNVMKYPE